MPTSGLPARPRAEPVRIAVAADHSLVAESVRAALHSRGYEPVVVRWPTVATDLRGAPGHRLTRRSAGAPPAAAVLLSDLARSDHVGGARRLISWLPVPWLVLAGSARGPAWGAAYDAGAWLVVPTSTGLDAACELLDELVAGTAAASPSWRQRRDLVRSWRELSEERDALVARFRSLTVREEEILQRLHAGAPVREIAEQGEVTESTVRGQVAAILRKLEVNSQLGAVAAYEQLQSDPPDRWELVASGGGMADPVERATPEIPRS